MPRRAFTLEQVQTALILAIQKQIEIMSSRSSVSSESATQPATGVSATMAEQAPNLGHSDADAANTGKNVTNSTIEEETERDQFGRREIEIILTK